MYEDRITERQADTVRATSPIDERLQRLADQAERLSNLVGSLLDRLGPVLSEAHDESGHALEARTSGGSPLHARMSSVIDLFELELERLGDLRARLEV